ncbi:uncharacterized protein LAESUDRAFT_626398, partial [Laetiporus sulphureus 93-53]
MTASASLATANDGILVLVKIETRDAMTNLDGILSVDGLGMPVIWCSRWSYGLSLSHGYRSPSLDLQPEVEVLIQNVRR